MYELILPLGIINFILIMIQLLSGFRIIKVSYKVHRYSGIALVISALLHGTIATFFT